MAARLARLLPSGADRCVVGRIGNLSPERRRAVAGLSAAADWLWKPELRVEAYATASRARRGHRSRVTVLVGPWTPTQWRQRLVAHSGLRISAPGEDGPEPSGECLPDACAARLRFLRDHTVIVESGPWHAVPGRRGVEADCRDQLERHGGAIEVVARRGPTRAATELVPFLRSHGRLQPRPGGVHAERIDTLPSPEVARAVMAAGLTAALFRWTFDMPQGLVGDVHRRLLGARLMTTLDASWTSLSLLVEDAERMGAARAEAVALAQVAPTQPNQPRQLDAVVHEVHYLVESLGQAFGAPRRELARTLRERLERATVTYPGRRDLARLLVSVLLDELGDGAAAVELARRMDGVEGADRAFWAQAERHGVALVAPKRLARTLRGHGMTSPGPSRVLAEMIVTGLAAGAPYDDAERAALAELSMGGRHGDRTTTVEGRFRIAPDVLLEGLLLVARQRGNASRLWLSVEGVKLPALGPRAFVRLRDGQAPLQLASLQVRDSLLARELGEALTRVTPGPVTLRLSPGHQDGPGEAVLRLEGRLAAGTLDIVAVGPAAAARAWPTLWTGLIEPLSKLSGGRLSLVLPSDAEARAARDLAQGAFGLPCELDGVRLACRTAAQGRRLAREVLSAVLARPLRALSRALYRAPGEPE